MRMLGALRHLHCADRASSNDARARVLRAPSWCLQDKSSAGSFYSQAQCLDQSAVRRILLTHQASAGLLLVLADRQGINAEAKGVLRVSLDRAGAMGDSGDPSTSNNGRSGPCRVVWVGCGSSHTIALLSTGMVVSFGRGEDGQLGHGDADERPLPQTIHTLENVDISSVYCGAEYSAAVSKSRSQVYSWGWGDFGRLGHGDITDLFLPRPIIGLAGCGIIGLACGDTHTLAMAADGKLFAFGRNQNGQLGIGTSQDSLSPVLVEALRGKKVISIAAGAEHSLAALEGGEVYSWGWGRYGNLGLEDKTDRWVPTLVPGLESVKITTVACGWRHSVIVDDQGGIWTFGWNRYGQLGLGSVEDEAVAQKVSALEGIKIGLISGGWRHTIAADQSGRLYSWGWNKFGQLGIGSTEDKYVPVFVGGELQDARVTVLGCGWRHNFAITDEGKAYAWGRGSAGQLGLGNINDMLSPTLMSDLSTETMDLEALRQRGPPPSAAAAYVPFADRYAVVPDRGTQGACIVPELTEPDVKRSRRTEPINPA